jgi:hypothetical protein
MPQIDRIGRLNKPVVITCTACGHATTWTPAEARARLGGECTVYDARRRLGCSACRREGRIPGDVRFSVQER